LLKTFCLPVIYFTVTTDLTYDQRMIRICTSLAQAGYKVVLVGRKTSKSVPLTTQPFIQKRLRCLFTKGFAFYAEYNLRLFFFLLFKKTDAVCAIDLDTILPCFYISKIKNVKRIYDAHELFCEMKEIVTRPRVYKWWKKIEKMTVPHFPLGYTVNEPIAAEFNKMYGSNYEVIRNIARYRSDGQLIPKERYILYQGAVNEGRSFETLIPAMKYIDMPMIICGKGNFYEQAVKLAEENGVSAKISFKGMIAPAELKSYTDKAFLGITLFENKGLSNYFSLANRFFDYLQSGVPQLCVDYPVYQEINNKYEVALLIKDLSPENIAQQINSLINDQNKWEQLHKNCIAAAKEYSWENEEKKLLAFYKNIFG
jgi:glycosyltransferase involved in cell wall biosynthesis